MSSTEDNPPKAGPSKPPPMEGSNPLFLSRKARVHYGRLYQVHAWMPEDEQIRVRTRKALFNKVHELRPGYFNHQVELMDDTTVKYHPCRDFQEDKCKHQTPIHYHTASKPSGKRTTYLVIHGCDLCFYGRWDLGFHTINICHLKHLLPKGTGESPWDRRARKEQEEKEKARANLNPGSKINNPNVNPNTIPIAGDQPSPPSTASSEAGAQTNGPKGNGKKRKQQTPPPNQAEKGQKKPKTDAKKSKAAPKQQQQGEANGKGGKKQQQKNKASTKNDQKQKAAKSKQKVKAAGANTGGSDETQKNIALLAQTVQQLATTVESQQIQHKMFLQQALANQLGRGPSANVDPSLFLLGGSSLSTAAGPSAMTATNRQESQDDQYIEDNYLSGSHSEPGNNQDENDEYVPEYVHGSHENPENQDTYIPTGSHENPPQGQSHDRDMQELNMDFEECMNDINQVENTEN